MCLIVRDEDPSLFEEALKSIRDHVTEIVVVDTGSVNQKCIEVAKRYSDRFEVYTGCNDPQTGFIEDFSNARAKSFSLATQKWVGWQDSDDVILGAENFNQLINENNNTQTNCICLAYRYAFNDKGECILNHYRERLVNDVSKFKWVNPVHEVYIPVENPGPINQKKYDTVIYSHQRHRSTKITEGGRNLRIMRKFIEKHGTSDARQLYYFGLELTNNNLLDEAIGVLTKYVEASGWDDERCLACLKLSQIFQAKNDLKSSLSWAYKALESRENWAECYFAVGRIYYFIALQNGPNAFRQWERCVHFLRLGLTMPPTQTMLFLNPLERELDVYEYLNMALNKMGDVRGAYEACLAALAKHPDAKNMAFNKVVYENSINVRSIADSMNVLMNNKYISAENVDLVRRLINKEVDATTLINNVAARLPGAEVPAPFTRASEISVQPKSGGKLDIIFWTGQAWETWDPTTLEGKGTGGSEIACVNMAREFVKRGHKVTVYGDPEKEGVYEGVDYKHHNHGKNMECDIFISSRAPWAADCGIKARAKFLWVHDIHCGPADANMHRLLLKFDRIFCLSNWHKSYFHQTYNFLDPASIVVTRNGIDVNRFKDVSATTPKGNNLIYSSSPPRGLDLLLDLMPEIISRVPDAKLDVYYGFWVWEKMANAYNNQADKDNIQRFKNRLSTTPGVTFHDRVSQSELAKAFMKAKVWSYCTEFLESSCISAMEAQAAGCVPVTSRIAAVAETMKHGIFIDQGYGNPEYRRLFVDAVVMLLKDDQRRIEYAKAGIEHGKTLGWDLLSSEWENIFHDIMSDVHIKRVPKYHSEARMEIRP
jgi:glycosyltransferase involved in cell wall biosynthesis/tetratricopeptide (TPR) repeat protein